ncbi:MAG: hypothetical protein Tsb0021_14370 [Chlamydiales bacterium]
MIKCSIFFIIFFLTFTPEHLLSVPWGKDADLARYRPQDLQKQEQTKTTRTSSLALKLIAFHQNVISRADGPRSHFVPSSSQYTKEAIQKYGFFKGFILGCDRLMRENDELWIYPRTKGPYCELKHDPVP